MATSGNAHHLPLNAAARRDDVPAPARAGSSASSPPAPATEPVVTGAQFGPYEIDFREQVLRKHGIRLKVPPQTLRVLICLLEHAPEVVEREYLFSLLWPSDTHVDFTGNLNAIIRDLRVLLGDSARSPRFIETEPRRGYRFIAPVGLVKAQRKSEEEIPALAIANNAPEQGGAVSFQARLARRLLISAAIVVATAGGLQWWRSVSFARSLAPPRITQLTSLAGQAGHASLSPDGSRVAFHWDGNESGNFNIYIADLATEQVTRLTRDAEDDLYPAWSPDGRDIAFLRRYPNGRCSIYLVPATGGSERLVRDVPTESSLSWSADGGWLAYTVLYWAAPKASSPDFGVYAVSLISGRVIRLTTPAKTDIGDQGGTFSPDGRRIAFFRSSSTGVSDLYVQDLDLHKRPQGSPTRITFDGQNSRYPAWTPDGANIVYSSLRGGVRSLWQVPVKPHAEPVQLGGENASQPVFDPAGKRIVYERITVHDTLQVLPLCGAGACPDVPPRRLAYSREVARNPSWSPDGRQIAFESIEHGAVQVWRCNRDGSNPRMLPSFKSPVSGTPHWSPDGVSLVLDSAVDGHSKLFLVNLATGTRRQLTRGNWEDITPTFSHDGKTVYFASNRSGQFEVWKLDIAGNVATQVTRHGGFYAQETPDGKSLLYAKGMHRTEVAQVPVAGGEEKTVIDSLSYWPDFAVSAHGLYYVPDRSERNRVAIWFHRFSDGSNTRIAVLPGVDMQGMSLSADEHELLLAVRSSAETNLMALSFDRNSR